MLKHFGIEHNGIVKSTWST